MAGGVCRVCPLQSFLKTMAKGGAHRASNQQPGSMFIAPSDWSQRIWTWLLGALHELDLKQVLQ